jgi:peptidoglycan-N-acetylglucosamine deacetylase
MEGKPRGNQVFFDPTGRRWRRVRVLIFLLLIAVGAFIFSTGPATLANPALPALQNQTAANPATAEGFMLDDTPTNKLADTLRREHLPVIGEGPLVRVVGIAELDNEPYAVELFTDTVTRQLDPRHILAVGDSQYAIERYGQTNSKQIALTFDDGPDPIYTAQVLDMLSERSIQATFFAVGQNIVRHEELARRIVSEGHVLANHSFSHAYYGRIGDFTAQQETVQTQRIIRAVTGHNSAFFRPPYVGNDDQSLRDNLKTVLSTQRAGYIVTMYDFDTSDWDDSRDEKLPMPDLTGNEDITILLHDAGGDRSDTVAYIGRLADAAQEHGYSFVNLNQLYYQESDPLFAPVSATTEDTITHTTAQLAMIWPRQLVRQLFILTVAALLLSLIINTTLAILHRRRSRRNYKRRPKNYRPLVSVLIPAYNESDVLAKTVSSLLKSHYQNLEVIIIDDGSTDDTWQIAQKIADVSWRVRCLAKPNGGKSSALNMGLEHAGGEIVICVDADTVFPPTTVSRLVRHFHDPTVGAVAGTVKVGNIQNPLTRWQALEYTVSIHVERAAHAYLGAIMVVPGACGAWRKEAIAAAGGYSDGTLAEDCDLTLAVHESGYKVIQDDSAVGVTEAPQTIRILAKQRFRWIFGNLQSFWKHRRIALDNQCGWLGTFVMPYAIFNTLVPIVFIPMLVTLAISNILAGFWLLVLAYMGAVLFVQFLAGFVGVRLARERLSLLAAVPLTRFIYSPLKTYLLYKSMLTIIRGARVGWNKFRRTGAVSYTTATRETSAH